MGGTLNVSLVDLSNGYTPAAGDRFDIITSANLPDFALGHTLTWTPIDFSDPRKVTLEITSAAPYDVDLDDDGDVDGSDFLAIQRTDPALIPAWEFEYGSGNPIIAHTKVVPEPAGIAFVGIGLITVVGFRQRTRAD